MPPGRPSPQPNAGSPGDLGLRFWCLVPATGAAAGLAAGLLIMLLRAVQRVAWGEGAAGFAAAVDATSWGRRVAVLLCAGLLAGFGGYALRHARGRHAGDLAATLWFHAGRLPFLPSLAQACLSIGVVGLGAALGRESAPKQAGAAFGSLFAGRLGLPPGQTRLLAAFGAGAGMAAVYDVPLGGGLFALEVLLGTLSLPLAAPALLTSGVATAVSWLLLPDRPTYELPASVVPPHAATASVLAFAVLAGPAAGLVSAAYVRLIAFADGRRPKGGAVSAVAAPVAVMALLGFAAIPAPELLGNGKDAAAAAFAGELGLETLLVVALLKPIATAACLGSGAPGGLFTPSITVGAAFGGLVALAWNAVWPGSTAGAGAVVFATAVLAATTQGPVSAVVLMLELTRTLGPLTAPMLVAVGGAMLVVRFIEPRSIYACRIHDALRDAEERASPSISVAAGYLDLLRALPALPALGGPPEGGALRAVDETGAVVGTISAARARDPARDDRPLAAACAGDFVDGPATR